MIVDNTIEKYSKIDILVNCAGTNVRKKFNDYSVKDWDIIQDVNLKSAFLLAQKIIPFMKKSNYGKIVNISSIQSVICWNGCGDYSIAPYAVSKAGINALTRSMALDLGKYNINVNAVCPGVIDGKWAKSILSNRKYYKDIISKTPLQRLCTHDDIAGLVLLLCSDRGSFITGQSILIDGGWTIN